MDRMEERDTSRRLVEEIHRLAERTGSVRLMEVCGTHTVAIFRAGIRQVLPKGVELVSGPGCPVCVTPDTYVDRAIAYAEREDVTVATFGDMLKVPGTKSSLAEAKAAGADVRVVYSPMESLAIAAENPGRRVVFLAVGFETTAPTAAATVLAAEQQGVKNLYMLSAQKLVPPAIRALLDDPGTRVDGFLLPGHVAVVTGTEPFKFLAEEYRLPGVVAGFEPLAILRALVRLMQQRAEGRAEIGNEYGSVVRAEGSPVSRRVMERVYEPHDVDWRGMGTIPASGLVMRPEYERHDIEHVMPLNIREEPRQTLCRCGEVLRGIATPRECPLFASACRPEHGVGPCMVSTEGVCAAWYKYGGGRFSYGG